MQPRRDLLTQFSTFLQFEGDRPRPWLSDPRLRRSMEQRLAEARSQGDANFWALFWHQQWLRLQTQPPVQRLAQDHLMAYAQDGCYWAAYQTVTRFNNLPYGLSDCFQLAIAQFQKILRGFDASYGADFSSYANAAFGSLIRETLRQQNEIDICSDWGLLRKLSKKRLTEALQAQGLGDATIATYILAWQGFKQYYVPTQATGTRQLSRPDADTWAAIAGDYATESRAHRDRPGAAPLPSASPLELETWLLSAARAARTYLYPTQVSVNAPVAGQETELIDSLVETDALSPLEYWVAEEDNRERYQQRQQLGDWLATLLQDQDEAARQLLELYYRDGLTQQAIAQQLQVQQYTISRRLTRLRKGMVEKLAQWSAQTLHTPLSLDLLNLVSSVLDEWLHHHYRSASPGEPTHE